MAVPTQYYVDPSLGSDTGDGSISTPWGRAAGDEIQYALDVGITRDATDGDQINVKSDQAVGVTPTVPVVMGAAMNVTGTYGTPTAAAPLIIRGYTAANNDGGIGGVSGGGSVAVIDATALDYVSFVDMYVHNVGSNVLLNLDQYCQVINCILADSSASLAVELGSHSSLVNCHMHTVTGATPLNLSGSVVRCVGNFLDLVGATVNGVQLLGASVFAHNILKVGADTSVIGVMIGANGGIYMNNSLYSSSANTSNGFYFNNATRLAAMILNNIVEGWSGIGGVAFNGRAATESVTLMVNNYYYNCAGAGDMHTLPAQTYSEAPNLLTSSAFTNPGSDDFSVDTQVKAGAYKMHLGSANILPYLDAGGVQREEPAGGGGVIRRIPKILGGS